MSIVKLHRKIFSNSTWNNNWSRIWIKSL